MAIFTLFATFTSAYAWFQSIRNEDANNEDFYITQLDSPLKGLSIHEYYGKTSGESTSCFTFNPTGVSIYADGSLVNNPATVELHEYSLDDPNHPVLLMFQVDAPEDATDFQAAVNLITDYAYLGAHDDFINAKTATKEALTALSNKVTSGYYQVVADESRSNKTTLYQYDGSNLVNMTYTTFAALNVDANKIADNADKYFRVDAIDATNNVSAIYQYKLSSRTFDMVWIDIGNKLSNQANPLSSAVEFHYFTFTADLEHLPTTHTITREIETYNSSAYEYSLTTEVQSDVSCIAIPTASFTNDNKSSFTTFQNDDTPVFTKELNVFSGNVAGCTYIGIVVDYDQLALEYIFSRYLGHNSLNAGLKFKCDWKTEF